MSRKLTQRCRAFALFATGLFLIQPLTAWVHDKESGKPLQRSYGPEAHGGRGLCYEIEANSEGKLFVANEAGLLEFDGTEWTRMVPTGYNELVSSLAIDGDQRIWICGFDSVGFYESTENGSYVYVDMTPSVRALPLGDDLSQFWDIQSDGRNIYLSTSYYLLRWDGNAWLYWHFNTDQRILPNLVDNELYLHSRGEGIFRLEEDRMVLFAEPSEAYSSGFISMMRATDGRLIAISTRDGIFHYEDGRFTPWHTEVDSIMEGRLTYCGLLTSDNLLILSIEGSGLFIIDEQGRCVTQIPSDSSWTQNIMEDRHGGIWFAQTSQVAYVPFSSVTEFPVTDQIDDVVRHQGQLYLSTRNSTLKLSPKSGAGEMAELHRVDPVTAGYDMLSTGDTLMHGGSRSLTIMDSKTDLQTQPHPRQVFGFAPSLKNPDLVYISDIPRISRLQKHEGKWEIESTHEEFHEMALSMVELPDGSLLVTTFKGGVQRVVWPSPGSGQGAQLQIESLGASNGLIEKFEWAYCLESEGHYLLISNLGAYRLLTETMRFIQDPALGHDLGTDGFRLEYCQRADGDGWIVWRPTPSHPQAKGELGILRIRNDRLSWEPLQLPALKELGNIESIYHEFKNGREILWLGGLKKLLRYELGNRMTFAPVESTLSSVSETQEGIVYYGGAAPPPRENIWTYPQQSLRIRFAALPHPLQVDGFQTKLKGFEVDWSEATALNFKEYTNLREGHYTFEVRAMDELGRVGPVAAYPFRILPPWYRTLYAYIGAALLLVLLVILLARWWTLRLRKRNEELELIVNQRTIELEKQNIELVKANSIKQDFLASMSHEIRNPLNGILGIAQLLKESSKRPQEDSERINHLNACASHLHQLLGQVLDYSSLEAGKLQVRQQPFNVAELLSDVTGMHRSLAQKKNIQLHLDSPEVPRLWIGDAVLIRQILINLVSNAIKYTPEGSVWIRLTTQERDSKIHAVFSVEDTGPGIPPDKHHFIFQDFTRLNKPGESMIAGTGLGLAIASEMSELMGGRLDLDSAYQSGARFVLELDFQTGEPVAIASRSKAAPSKQSLRGRCVLVADDMDFNRYLSRKILEKLGAEVHEAEDGEQALSLLGQRHYDLAVLDINMPKRNGADVVRTFLQSDPASPPYFVALSAHVTNDMEHMCLDAGYSHFLEKPLQPEKLIQVLANTQLLQVSSERPAIDSSLLDYLANQNPAARAQLQERFNSSFLNELSRLRNFLNQGETESIRESIHKLKGLMNIQRNPKLIALMEKLSDFVKKAPDAPKGAIRICDAIEAEIRQNESPD
ncbi:hybrid sensor histidine kinase/response regulator [Coraliomargarita parva]|uniref:hybrid sensor histidine kinase/response regulator n=1 Tax=Coraliomargarita parva TaxID=3014050 RepID=UPI0022B375BE|nr:hybrid sensor histidine kinase/response regulator [Coraliomargarita parva]